MSDVIVLEDETIEDAPILEDAPEPPAPTILSAELQAILSSILAASNANTLAAVAEMRKPSAEEQEKIDAQRARDRAQKHAAIRMGEQTAEQQRRLQSVCDHSQPNGKTAFRGQVNSDNCYRLYCHHCQYISPPIHATPEQIAGGLNLSTLPAASLTIASLERAAAASPGPDPIRSIPLGLVADNTDL